MKPNAVTYIWPSMGRTSHNMLTFKATGYTGSGSHWNGEKTIAIKDPAYPFWMWIYLNRWVWPPVINETLLDRLKPFFVDRCQSDELVSLEMPIDSNILYQEMLQTGAENVLDQLLSRFGTGIFTDLSSVHDILTRDALRSICTGLVEVFCYRAGKCEFFGIFAEDITAFELNAKMLAKRL